MKKMKIVSINKRKINCTFASNCKVYVINPVYRYIQFIDVYLL